MQQYSLIYWSTNYIKKAELTCRYCFSSKDYELSTINLSVPERGISFEDALFFINNGGLLDDVAHTNTKKYPNQRMFFINIDEYIYLVPYVENGNETFLKKIIPSRKATKLYIGDK
jgi:hypothetical protein